MIKSYGGREVPYDLLVSIPPNFGAQCIIDSGMGDPMGYVETDHNTLKAKKFDSHLRDGRRRQRAHFQGRGRGPL